MPKNSRVVGIICVLLSSMGFSLGPTLAKKTYEEGANALGVMTIRFTIAAIVMIAIRLITMRQQPWPRVADLLKLLLCGILIMGISLSYFVAIDNIDTGLAIVLFYSNPLFVVAGSWLVFKKRPNRNIGISLTFTMIGIVITVGQIGSSSTISVALVLLSALLFSVYLLGMAHSLSRVDVFSSVAIVNTGAALGYWAVALTSPWAFSAKPPNTTTGWMLIGAFGVVGTVLPLIASFSGIKLVGPSMVSVLTTLEPVLAISAGVIFLGEPVAINRIIGAIFVLGALIALSVLESRTDSSASLGVIPP